MQNKILKLNISLFLIIALVYFSAPGNYLTEKSSYKRTVASTKKLPTRWGFEFEFTGHFAQNSSTASDASLRKVSRTLYTNPLKIVKKIVGGDNPIKVSKWEKDPNRKLMQAEWIDSQGRKWLTEPEWVNFPTADGVELVTPPLTKEDDAIIIQILEKILQTGEYGMGWRSGVHFTMEVENLIAPDGKCPKLVDFILNAEKSTPEIYNAISPVRYGTIINRFGVPLAADFPDLFEKLATLPEADKTFDNIQKLFEQYWEKEIQLWQITDELAQAEKKAFKYRAINYRKLFGLGDTPKQKIVEFRILDLDTEKEIMKNSRYLRRFYEYAANTPADGFKSPWGAKRSIKEIEQLNFDRLNQKVISLTKTKFNQHLTRLGYNSDDINKLRKIHGLNELTLSSTQFEKLINEVDLNAPVIINGKELSIGFELEFQPSNNDHIFEYYNNNEDFKFLPKFSFMEDYIYDERTGNRELHSKPATIMNDMWEQMKLVKKSVETPKGFHLHMRFPESRLTEIGDENFHGWLSRLADSIVGWRIEHKKTYYSLNTVTQARLDPTETDTHGAMRFVDQIDDMIDIEIRGFMTSVDQIERMARIIVTGLKNPEYIQGFYQYQALLFPMPARDPLISSFNRFMQRFYNRELTVIESEGLKTLSQGYNGAIADINMLLPILGYDHMPYFTSLEQRRFQDASVKFFWWLKTFVLDKMEVEAGRVKPDLDLNVAFRHQIKKWAQETNWAAMMQKTLLMNPVTNMDHLNNNPAHIAWLVNQFKKSHSSYNKYFIAIVDNISDEQILTASNNLLTPDESTDLLELIPEREELQRRIVSEQPGDTSCLRNLIQTLDIML